MNEKRRAIFINADECLIPKDGSVSDEFYDALKRISYWVGKGNQGTFPNIVLYTERNEDYIEVIASLIGRIYFWSIIESGAGIFNLTTRELISNPALSPETKKAFERIVLKKEVPKILKMYNKGLSLFKGNQFCVIFERKPGAILTIEAFYEGIRKEMKGLIRARIVMVTYSDSAVYIIPHDIIGTSGLRFLAQHCGIDLKQSIGIGGSKKDIPLLRRMKLIGCPANANEFLKHFVKDKRGRVSFHSYARGVADIIDYYMESKED